MTAHPQHTLRLDDWTALSADAKTIRFEVFVEEQKVPAELEMDHMDAVACTRSPTTRPARRSAPAACCRTATSAAWPYAKARGDRKVMLSSQTHAAPFYARHGFQIEGDEFFEAGIAHINMVYTFG